MPQRHLPYFFVYTFFIHFYTNRKQTLRFNFRLKAKLYFYFLIDIYQARYNKNVKIGGKM